MTGTTKSEVIDCLGRLDELRVEEHRVFFNDSYGSLRLALQLKETFQLAHVALLLAALGYNQADFRGAYLWITTWGVWGPPEEAEGLKILEQFRRSYGENRSLELAPGSSFRDDEFIESVCCLLQPMLIGWDAYYVPRWSYGHIDYFVAVSHDSFVQIHVRTKEKYGECLEIFRKYDWIKFSENLDRSV